MLQELRQASNSYVSIANHYDQLVEECASLEFIAINAGIASKQANNDSFMKLSSEIQIMSANVTESAHLGRATAFTCLDATAQSFGQLLTMMRFYGLFETAYAEQAKLGQWVDLVRVGIEQYDISGLKKATSQMARSLGNLIALVNIGKTMAIGGKIKAVYIAGSEEKFRIITETMQESIDRLFELLEKINIEFGIIQNLFSNMTSEEV
ncbi:MAG: hypothetical protein A2600_06400 [Candidatus Lambdaproteobacteria bacterium RIFOXYD1_FULL_56_27]|uniref:Methyl-accepting transducer domain-containing protein n=1 Tax=Candidatus Lambdaproteobacteria bacterium RIFOXYD2_FULL_56_26 TaxID=1817773 RepID=A0A1F6H0B5_9PROT|nr:MAG: hypothetical protein A2426_05815 [Candidatus Lambdaproteobacteria bacterium RIFOXYC1_FULL_56_13]OGH03838.1 MAG: hypothetical protein A2557_11910 [Candidatus Lambdaproteobacteria bacterium RIFOXYD2_FULL_56_26]OGH08966.1 MAG: hypothetical protein A2600_06400 [Candidatus Lambdaproteobacteria bacterium RIFOXYD1_FULL_56_27]